MAEAIAACTLCNASSFTPFWQSLATSACIAADACSMRNATFSGVSSAGLEKRSFTASPIFAMRPRTPSRSFPMRENVVALTS